MSNLVQKVKNAALVGLTAGTMLAAPGCSSILNSGDSSYVEVKVKDGVTWSAYQKNPTTGEQREYKTGTGSQTIYMDKTNCNKYTFSTNTGITKELKAKPFWLGLILDVFFGPLMPVAFSIDSATGAAISYEKQIDLTTSSEDYYVIEEPSRVVFENGVPVFKGASSTVKQKAK